MENKKERIRTNTDWFKDVRNFVIAIITLQKNTIVVTLWGLSAYT